MSDAISGVGVQLLRESDDSSGEYETMGEINSIEGPDPTRETIDVTHLMSTGGKREFIGSFRDMGEVRAECNFTRAFMDIVVADFDSDDIHSYQISFPDADTTKLTFDGFITGWPLSVSPDDKITMSITIKVSGEIVESS